MPPAFVVRFLSFSVIQSVISSIPSASDSPIDLVFGELSEIRSESPRARASNHGGVGKSADF